MRIFVAALVMLGLLNTIQAQEKLKTDGYGSLSGKVTLTGDLPKVTDFTGKMKDSNDKQCCLAPTAKPIEKVDQTWMVDPKTKAVKNAMVWVMPPKDTYFEINFRYKKRSEIIVIDQPHCQFLPFVSAFNPVYFDGKKLVPTGQQLIFKNSATVAHAVQAIGSLSMGNKGFNRVVASGGQLDCLKDLEEEVQFKPQLLPYNLACNTHPWMQAKLFVFAHPYYCLTDEKGSYEIPYVPAGAEIRLYAHHEGVGYVSTGGKMGQAITIERDKKHTHNFEFKAP